MPSPENSVKSSGVWFGASASTINDCHPSDSRPWLSALIKHSSSHVIASWHDCTKSIYFPLVSLWDSHFDSTANAVVSGMVRHCHRTPPQRSYLSSMQFVNLLFRKWPTVDTILHCRSYLCLVGFALASPGRRVVSTRYFNYQMLIRSVTSCQCYVVNLI